MFWVGEGGQWVHRWGAEGGAGTQHQCWILAPFPGSLCWSQADQICATKIDGAYLSRPIGPVAVAPGVVFPCSISINLALYIVHAHWPACSNTK